MRTGERASGRAKIRQNAGRTLIIDFESPWSPPMAGLATVSAKFPDLTFELEYFEGGMGFQGCATFKAGETVRDESREYSGPRGG